jgi:hypothetical protein
MAADAFTQIRNVLFRDVRLSAKAKGIFGYISTHRDGWGVTPESIAASMTDGVSAIRSGLRELEALGYLVREQPRRRDGTMGAIEYYITDQPSSEPVVENRSPDVTSGDVENRRSEPVDGKSHAVEPHADGRPHKKTIPLGKKISSEKTTSSSPAEPVGTEPPAVPVDVTDGGGGGGSDLRSTAEYIAGALDYRGKPPDKQQRKVIEVRLAAALGAGWSMDGLAVYLDLGDAAVNSPAAVYAHRLHPDRLPDAGPLPAPAARGGIRGDLPSAEVIESLTLEDVFGPVLRDTADGGLWERASARARERMAGKAVGGGTDDRVAGWGTVARELAQREPRVPHCGDWDCDPITRLRDRDEGGGLKSSVRCAKCHPKAGQ